MRRLALSFAVLTLFALVGHTAPPASAPVGGVSSTPVNAADAVLDAHALAAPPEAETSLATLTAYLTSKAKTERDRARAIYRWMTDRIAYDAETFLAGRPIRDVTPETVLRTRKTVCSGYANLFAALAQRAGLEVRVVRGYAKGYSYRPGEALQSCHAWNAVRIDGQWHLLDVTWATGSVDAKKGFSRHLNDHYFLTPPEALIFSHFPEDPRLQLLPTPVSAERFRQWPKVPAELLRWGVQPQKLRALLDDRSFRGLPNTYLVQGTNLCLDDVPLQKQLRQGEVYEVRVRVPNAQHVAVITGDNVWVQLAQIEGAYVGRFRAQGRRLVLCVQLPNRGESYQTCLEYEVE